MAAKHFRCVHLLKRIMLYSAGDKSIMFFLFWLENTLWHFMQIVSKETICMKYQNTCLLGKLWNIFQNVICWKFYPSYTSTFWLLLITKTRLFKYIETFTTKNGKFSDRKKSDIFYIPAQNIDCGYSLEPPRRGGSNEYPHSMFLSRNKKTNVYPCKPQFYYIKMGFKGVKLYRRVFVMVITNV